MTANIGSLVADLRLETSAFHANMKKATSELNSNVARMKRSMSSLEKGFSDVKKAAGLLTGAFVALQAGQGAAGVLKLADGYNLLQGRIKQATKETRDYAGVSAELSAIAKNTGSSLETTVGVFQRLTFSAKALGASNAEMLKFTDAVQKMGVVSGASNEAMQAGLMQLSQAMSMGRVHAEEMNSVMENLPALAVKIEQGLGLIPGSLKSAVASGKVLSKDVFEVILKQSDDINKEFADMPVTMDRGFNKLQISMTEAIGQIDQATGATQGLARMFSTLADWIDKNRAAIIAVTKFILQFGETAVQMGTMVVSGIGVATNAVATGILNTVSTAMSAVEGLVNTSIKFVNVLISNLNTIPGVKIGSMGNFSMPGKGAVNTLAKMSWNDAGMFGNSFMNTGRDIWSGKSMFAGMGMPSNAGGVSNYRSSGLSGGGGESGKGKKGKRQGKSDAQKEMERLQQEAKSLTEAMRTIWEVESDEITKANKLFKLKLIDLKTYNRALDDAKDKAHKAFKVEGLDEAMEKFTKPMKDWKDKFDSSLGDALGDTGFQEVQKVIEDTLTPLEQYNQRVDYLNYLHENAGLSTEVWGRALKDAKADLDSSSQSANGFAQAVGNVVAEFGDKFFDTLSSGLSGAKVSMKDFVASALQDLAKLIFKLTVTIPLANALTYALGGSRGGGAGNAAMSIGGNILTKAISGLLTRGAGGGGFMNVSPVQAFAAGGTPPVGVPSLVGEKGPELFVPRSAGTIIPNSQLGGGPTIQVTNVFNISTGVQQTVRAEIAAMMPSIQKQTVGGVMTAINRGGSAAATVGRKA